MPLVVTTATTPVIPPGMVRLQYVPAEAGAVVTAVRLYTDPARTGTPVFSGTPTNAAGTWTFDAPLADGDYYSAFDVTDSTGGFTDRGDFFLVADGEVIQTIVSLSDTLRHLFKKGNRDFTAADLAEARTRDGGEVTLLLQAATRPLEEKAGAILPRLVTERVRGHSTTIVLRESPALALVSVSGDSGVLTGGELDGPAGLLHDSPYGVRSVTYTVGRSPIPANIRKAALTWIAYWWSREHGGNGTYLPPDGIGVAGGVMGVSALDRQIDALLGPDRRGMRVA